jgi:hypothetical protein
VDLLRAVTDIGLSTPETAKRKPAIKEQAGHGSPDRRPR